MKSLISFESMQESACWLLRDAIYGYVSITAHCSTPCVYDMIGAPSTEFVAKMYNVTENKSYFALNLNCNFEVNS